MPELSVHLDMVLRQVVSCSADSCACYCRRHYGLAYWRSRSAPCSCWLTSWGILTSWCWYNPTAATPATHQPVQAEITVLKHISWPAGSERRCHHWCLRTCGCIPTPSCYLRHGGQVIRLVCSSNHNYLSYHSLSVCQHGLLLSVQMDRCLHFISGLLPLLGMNTWYKGCII